MVWASLSRLGDSIEKPKFIWQDSIAVASIALNYGARIVTNIVNVKISTYAQQAITAEASPGARAINTSFYISLVTGAVALAILLSYYLYLRKSRNKSEGWLFAFNTFTLIFGLMALLDFLNDISVYIGLLIH